MKKVRLLMAILGGAIAGLIVGLLLSLSSARSFLDSLQA